MRKAKVFKGTLMVDGDLVATVQQVFSLVVGAEVGPDDDFFGQGGDSLGCVVVQAHLEDRLALRLSPSAVFEHPTASELAAAIDTRAVVEAESPVALAGREVQGPRSGPISLAQEASLLTSSFVPSRGFLSWVYQLNGALDVAALAGAFDDIVRSNDVLRTRFVAVDGTTVQQVDAYTPGVLEVVELGASTKLEGLTAAMDETRATFAALSARQDPRLRATLYRIGPKTHILSVFVADALVDGMSGDLLAAELTSAYARRVGLPIPDLPVSNGMSYLDYVGEHLPSPVSVERAVAHWKRLVDPTGPVGDWPLEVTDPEHRATALFKLPPAEWSRVVEAAQVRAVTPYVIVLSSLVEALHAVAGAEDFLVTSAVSGRGHPNARNMIGAFMSRVRIEAAVRLDDGFDDIVRRTSSAVHQAIAHSVVPVSIVEAHEQLPAPYVHPRRGIEFHLFPARRGPDFAGVRQRRFRLHGGNEALRLNCAPADSGACGFFFFSASAPRLRVAELASAVHAVLGTAVGRPLDTVPEALLDPDGLPVHATG